MVDVVLCLIIRGVTHRAVYRRACDVRGREGKKMEAECPTANSLRKLHYLENWQIYRGENLQ